MHRRRGIRGIEESLAESIGRTWTGEALVKQHGPVGHGLIEFGERWMSMLGPLIRMPTAHGRDPLSSRGTFGHALASRRQHLLHFAKRCGVFENRVVAGA